MILSNGRQDFVPDFLVATGLSSFLVHSGATPAWIAEAALEAGLQYQQDRYDLLTDACRLANARDLLRYANYSVSLGDRVRLLALLDEYGSMPLHHCAQAIKNSPDAVGTIASLALQRIISMELDEELIGPETRISRS